MPASLTRCARALERERNEGRKKSYRSECVWERVLLEAVDTLGRFLLELRKEG